jgi:hypothetical protein
MSLVSILLWLADRCWWVVYRHTQGITCMRIEVQLFLGEPDAIGSYAVTTLTRDYGPKA